MSEWRETEIGKIPKDWDFDKLKNHLTIKGRIGWKGLKISEYTNEGPFIIGGLQFKNDKIVWEECSHITIQRYNESPEIMLRNDDILMTKDGTIGKLAYITNLNYKATVASHIHVIRSNSSKVVPKFLFYFFKSPIFQFVVESKITGSVVPALTQFDINNTYFPIPKSSEQKVIAGVLSTLDDKIDLLHRQNKTLEAMAETLFRQWFIEEADESWEESMLEEILEEIQSGSRPKGGIDPELREGIPSIGAENINGLGFYDFSKTKFVNREFYQKSKKGIIKDYDVLIYKDGAYIGRKGMFANGFPFKECMINEHVFILRSNIKANQLFLYFLLDQEELQSLNANSAQPGLNQASMKSLGIVLPPKGRIDEFEKISKVWIDKIFFNSNQIRTLEKLRDTLLPKLMSGEVRVRE